MVTNEPHTIVAEPSAQPLPDHPGPSLQHRWRSDILQMTVNVDHEWGPRKLPVLSAVTTAINKGALAAFAGKIFDDRSGKDQGAFARGLAGGCRDLRGNTGDDAWYMGQCTQDQREAYALGVMMNFIGRGFTGTVSGFLEHVKHSYPELIHSFTDGDINRTLVAFDSALQKEVNDAVKYKDSWKYSGDIASHLRQMRQDLFHILGETDPHYLEDQIDAQNKRIQESIPSMDTLDSATQNMGLRSKKEVVTEAVLKAFTSSEEMRTQAKKEKNPLFLTEAFKARENNVRLFVSRLTEKTQTQKTHDIPTRLADFVKLLAKNDASEVLQATEIATVLLKDHKAVLQHLVKGLKDINPMDPFLQAVEDVFLPEEDKP